MAGLLDPSWQQDGLSLSCRLRPGATLAADDSGLMATHPWGASRLDGVDPNVLATLEALAGGWLDGAAFATMCAEAGTLPQHVWVLERLGFLLSVRLLVAGEAFLTIEPCSYAARPPLELSGDAGRGLSRFAFLRRQGDRLVVESAVSAHRAHLHGEAALLLAADLARGEPAAAAGEAQQAAIGLLDAVGMLEGSESNGAGGCGEELLQTAEFHDLLLHRSSRFGRHDSAFGGSFPFLDEQPPTPAAAAHLADRSINLPRPSRQVVRERDPTLTQALEGRASKRDHGPRPLTLPQLGEFLFRCARVRSHYGPLPEANMPYQAADRPYPSGGGVHELELYLIANEVEDLRPGAYRYGGDRHVLEPLPLRPEPTTLMIGAAMQASASSRPPQLLIKIASRFGRVTWKYRAISYATTLKNVGVLYQTMYLVATAMGLAACALGSGDDVAGDEALGLASRSELGVGEFMLGTAAPQRSSQPTHRAEDTWEPMVEPNWGRD